MSSIGGNSSIAVSRRIAIRNIMRAVHQLLIVWIGMMDDSSSRVAPMMRRTMG